jgi:GST-like protein
MLEECDVLYRLVPVDISKGEQLTADFLKISPNNKIPVIVDHDNNHMPVFESGAVLIYLAEKYSKFIGCDAESRTKIIQWLMFQMSGIGPTFGQLFHFSKMAPENIPYAIKRYHNEATRLLSVVEKQLEKNQYIAGDYSIADMAIYPWLNSMTKSSLLEMSNMPNITKWMDLVGNRDSVKLAMNIEIS